MRFLKGLGLAMVCLMPLGTLAAEIKVMASTGVSSMFQKLIPEFERSSGHRVLISYDTSNIIMGKVAAGESADLLVLTAPLIDQLTARGKLKTGSRVDLARSGIGVAVREGAPLPDISSVEGFKQTLLQAKSVAYTATGASGVYFSGLVDRLGIGPQVNAKSIKPAGGIVAELVAKGDADVCIQMISELQGVPGARYLGPLPQALQMYTVFSLGVDAQSRNSEATRQLTEFLITPAAIRVYEAAGMERVANQAP